ncbi:MAG: CRISPR-associated endonuclease Cas1 [Alphaproteobacteria bacterium]|nr:MAG: CRISPR-associated endonuclease Cas1 [Alphaproteobacteria bacterium]
MGGTLFIDRRGARIARDAQALRISVPDAPPRRIPVTAVRRLVVRGSASIEVAALNLLWEEGVALLCLTGRRDRPAARIHGGPHADAAVRLAQYRLWHDGDTRLAWARELLAFRIAILEREARRILERRRGRRRSLSRLADATAKARRGLAAASTPDALRGVEGALAAAWFRILAELLPASLGFTTRRRRPPPDPVNALLSLGYTIATAEAATAAVRAGLDPAIGLLHGLAHGREALALDLVEPARPLVDGFVHDLFHGRRLEARHFSDDGKGGVLLGKAGRRIFYEAWEQEAARRVRGLVRVLAREGVRRLRNRPPDPILDQASDGDDIPF